MIRHLRRTTITTTFVTYLCFTSGFADPFPDRGGGSDSILPRGVKYAGPIVYSHEMPPIVQFPSPPLDSKLMDWGRNGQQQQVKYIPLPHHDLPILIYQSASTPPIHVVGPPGQGGGGGPPRTPQVHHASAPHHHHHHHQHDSYGASSSKTEFNVPMPPSSASPPSSSYRPYHQQASFSYGRREKAYGGGDQEISASRHEASTSNMNYGGPVYSSASEWMPGPPQDHLEHWRRAPPQPQAKPQQQQQRPHPHPRMTAHVEAAESSPAPHIIYTGHPPIHVFHKSAFSQPQSPQSILAFPPPAQVQAQSQYQPLGNPLSSYYDTEAPSNDLPYGSGSKIEVFVPPQQAPSYRGSSLSSAYNRQQSYSHHQHQHQQDDSAWDGSDSVPSYYSQRPRPSSPPSPQVGDYPIFSISYGDSDQDEPSSPPHQKPRNNNHNNGGFLSSMLASFAAPVASYAKPPRNYAPPPKEQESRAPREYVEPQQPKPTQPSSSPSYLPKLRLFKSPQKRSKSKYAIAPKAWHKPPIIIYAGVKPPVHVYKKPQGEDAQVQGGGPIASGSSVTFTQQHPQQHPYSPSVPRHSYHHHHQDVVNYATPTAFSSGSGEVYLPSATAPRPVIIKAPKVQQSQSVSPPQQSFFSTYVIENQQGFTPRFVVPTLASNVDLETSASISHPQRVMAPPLPQQPQQQFSYVIQTREAPTVTKADLVAESRVLPSNPDNLFRLYKQTQDTNNANNANSVENVSINVPLSLIVPTTSASIEDESTTVSFPTSSSSSSTSTSSSK